MNIKLAYKNFASFGAPGSGYKKWGVIFCQRLLFFMKGLTCPFFLHIVRLDERLIAYWPLRCIWTPLYSMAGRGRVAESPASVWLPERNAGCITLLFHHLWMIEPVALGSQFCYFVYICVYVITTKGWSRSRNFRFSESICFFFFPVCIFLVPVVLIFHKYLTWFIKFCSNFGHLWLILHELELHLKILKNSYKILAGEPEKERDHLEVLDIDVRQREERRVALLCEPDSATESRHC
jgi:hypothetical protein